MSSEVETTENLRFHTIDRLINVLSSNDKSSKRRAFLEIKTLVKSSSGDEKKELFNKLVNSLRISLQDSTEFCREQALEIIYDFIKILDIDKGNIILLLPAIHSRICREEDYELSEEIRLLHVKLLILLIDKYKEDTAPYTSDIVDILSKLIADDAPEVKKFSCACLIRVANTNGNEFFQNTKKCVIPLNNNLSHQHWRVRAAAVEAIEWIMIKGDNKCLPEFINPLSRRLLDDSPFVRLAVTKLAGHWLVDLVDRYSFFSSLLPMILTSLTDECEEIVKEAKTLWAKAGNQFIHENEKDYKDSIDYEPSKLEHYPPGVDRPGLGCRILVKRECSKFVLAIGKELDDWVTLVKIKSAQLLSQVTLHAETNITMHIDKLIGPMSKAAMDKDVPTVVSFVRLAAYYLGFFVPPKVYCDLIVEYMKEANYGERRIIASIISSSRREDLKEHLPKVVALLDAYTFKEENQEALLEVVSSIFKTCQEDSLVIGENIFSALVAVIGLAKEPLISQNAAELLQEFVSFNGGSKKETYAKFCKPLLGSLKGALWTVYGYEQFVFYALVTHTGEVISNNLEEIMAIITDALSEKSDPEVQLKIYMAVNEIIKDRDVTLPTIELKESFSKIMLSDILPLHLKWAPGKSAEAIRTISCTTLYLIFSSLNLDFSLPAHLIPLLHSLIEDAAEKTRILALLTLSNLCAHQDLHQSDTFTNIITNVLKRLDDCSRKVREISILCIQKLYEAHVIKVEHDHINMAVVDFVYSTCLIHLDDADQDFRKKVFTCLDSIASIEPIKLREKLFDQNFRDKEILENLKTSIGEKLKLLNLNESLQVERQKKGYQENGIETRENSELTENEIVECTLNNV